MRKPAKVVGCLIVGLADDRQVQAAADHATNISERNALVGDPVIPGSCGTPLKRQPKEMGSIKLVHSGSAIESIADIR